MAVFRIERTRDYTVMSNHHLRNANLSLKAKGLLSMMLSLPEDWNYTTRGLAKICKEGVDAIGAALRELEGAGYIVRHQRRDKSGRITDTEYVIYEQPQPDMCCMRTIRRAWCLTRRKSWIMAVFLAWTVRNGRKALSSTKRSWSVRNISRNENRHFSPRTEIALPSIR